MIFRLYCPKLIYQYSDIGDYENSGKYIRQLLPFIEQIETKRNLEKYFDIELLINNKYKGHLPKDFKFSTPIENRDFIDEIFYIYSEYHYLNTLQFTYVQDNPIKTREKHQFLDLHFKNLFDKIFIALNKMDTPIRSLIGLLYFLGSFLVSITIIENLLFVIKHSFFQ